MKQVEITNIELLGEEETVDICVEGTHMFFANDIYTHNSGFNTEVNDEQSIGKAIEPLQVADWMIIFSQSVDEAEAIPQQCKCRLLKNRWGPKGLLLLMEYDPDMATFRTLGRESLTALYNREELNGQKESVAAVKKWMKKRGLETEEP